MVELVVRALLAGGLLALSLTAGKPPFDSAWRVSAFFATYAFLAYAMERRGLRNAGVAGLFAVADSGLLSYVLASLGQLQSLGFLTLLPPAWAVVRFGSDAMAMAPIVTAWVLIGANLLGGPGWTPLVLLQGAGILAVGLLTGRRIQTVTVTEYVDRSADEEVPLPQGDLVHELRERCRILANKAAEGERKGRRERVASLLFGLEGGEASTVEGLARRIADALGVEGLALYALDSQTERMVVQSWWGHVSPEIAGTSLVAGRSLTEWQLRDRLAAVVAPLHDAHEGRCSGTVVLKDKGRVTGMAALVCPSTESLDDALSLAGESAEILSRALTSALQRADDTRRLRQAEVLYSVSVTAQGADTPSALAARVAREVWESVRLDHLSVVFIQDGEPAVVALHGASVDVLSVLNGREAQGLAEWLAEGCPEILIPDARGDSRVPRDLALKQRLGSVAVLPVGFAEEPYGYVCAATSRAHGLDTFTVETLRIVTAELGQAVARIENGHRETSGLALPTEFHAAVKQAGEGTLVYVEVLRREELESSYGHPAVEAVLRRLAQRLVPTLPAGAVMCRRAEGDIVVFLRTGDETHAAEWANRAATVASMVWVTRPDGQGKVPLGVRTKTARIAQQSHRISLEAGS